MRAGAAFAAALLTVAAPSQAQTVRPTSATVPANLLRLSVVFDEPPSGPVLPRLALRLPDGSLVDQPFLDQELWSPDGRIVTILMHPGRVKTGLAASERLGRALSPGRKVTVTLDGRPLKTWLVTEPDDEPPMPSQWSANAPRGGTRDALSVRLDGQIDSFGADLVAVRAADGSRVPGRGELAVGETVWRFLPDRPWSPGPYSLVAASTLEDPSGNRPGSTFEHRPGAEDGLEQGPTFEVETPLKETRDGPPAAGSEARRRRRTRP